MFTALHGSEFHSLTGVCDKILSFVCPDFYNSQHHWVSLSSRVTKEYKLPFFHSPLPLLHPAQVYALYKKHKTV